ncbi:helix-turn-helix domain-containing protein [Streptomyces sp. NPDC016172]|uniref:helix-turn-helix domain-containing protein n=1 Tax=Streptomyces sp. NPDC016172 TaxID=3364964 RepID=UPI0036FFC53B
MRYAQGGGPPDAGRAAREQIRLQAVERFDGGQKNRETAAALRVSERSVERWRRQWRERGKAGVLSKGYVEIRRQVFSLGCRGIPASPFLAFAPSVRFSQRLTSPWDPAWTTSSMRGLRR